MLRVLYVLAHIILRLVVVWSLMTAGCAGPVTTALWVEDCLYFLDPEYPGSVPHAPQCGDPEALGTMIR